jgi:putative DNA methylase
MSFYRRNLPHWIPEDTDVFVTWRLAGSLPCEEEQLDRAEFGPAWLQDARIARVVAETLVYGEEVRGLYELQAWVIMPNHVHVIMQPHTALATIMRWLKGRTGRLANEILGRARVPFWQDESFDQWVRNSEELQDLIAYVENNPVKAGFVEAPHMWPWSSACRNTDDKNRSSVPLKVTL